ncbi:unnamed protein product [Amoebophrya sp. A120]|nr:unnamed protein product [Amoebophrya sp. A120]|eukprot:GSA120T00013002001.1
MSRYFLRDTKEMADVDPDSDRTKGRTATEIRTNRQIGKAADRKDGVAFYSLSRARMPRFVAAGVAAGLTASAVNTCTAVPQTKTGVSESVEKDDEPGGRQSMRIGADGGREYSEEMEEFLQEAESEKDKLPWPFGKRKRVAPGEPRPQPKKGLAWTTTDPIAEYLENLREMDVHRLPSFIDLEHALLQLRASQDQWEEAKRIWRERTTAAQRGTEQEEAEPS